MRGVKTEEERINFSFPVRRKGNLKGRLVAYRNNDHVKVLLYEHTQTQTHEHTYT